MVAKFLEAELPSERFGPAILKAMDRLEVSEELILEPNLSDEEQNLLRDNLLGEARGWKRGKYIFHNFPESIDWYEIKLSPSELEGFKYINHSYWLGISGGSRMVGDAASNIRKGKEVLGESNQPFFEVATEIESGKVFPEIILVAENEGATPVILEGHRRATAFALAKRKPETIKAILGVSPGIKEWANQHFH